MDILRSGGVKEVDYTNENWIRLYKREKYVYDRLVENAKKYGLNNIEISTPPLGHAFQYFDSIVIKLEKKKFQSQIIKIMIDKELEKKLEQFLKEKNRLYYDGSIEYLGLRECGTIDGKIRTFHLVSYMVSLSDQSYDGDGFFCARFDEKKHYLVEIIGPQSWENFEE